MRRVHSPKAGKAGATRPIGIPTLEDKILQRAVHRPTQGTPQGGVISPLLANLYLHEVLDPWFEHTVKPCLNGRAFMVRYAGDTALAFAQEEDARRVLAVLAKRLAKYGLTRHPDKTRLVNFRRPGNGSKRGHRGPSFDLLGFTHYWGTSRKGQPVIKRKTAKGRMNAALKRITQWCKAHRHWPIAQQCRALIRQLAGHYADYGITGNGHALRCFHRQVERRWRYWLSRRSRKAPLS